MSTNKTEHYQLNQWEATDLVQRTDFNADNAKLDSALHDLAARKEDTTQVDAKIAAESQARAADVAALREEQMWVKVGEAVSDGTATSLTVTIPNAERYIRYSLQYSVENLYALGLYFNGQQALNHFNSTTMVARAIGRVELEAADTDHAVIFYHLLVVGNSINNIHNNYISARIFSGTPTVALKTERGAFHAGMKFSVYGLKK